MMYLPRGSFQITRRAGKDLGGVHWANWPPLLSGQPPLHHVQCGTHAFLPTVSEVTLRKSKITCSFVPFQSHPSHLIQGLIPILVPFLLHAVMSKTHVQLVSRIRNIRQFL